MIIRCVCTIKLISHALTYIIYSHHNKYIYYKYIKVIIMTPPLPGRFLGNIQMVTSNHFDLDTRIDKVSYGTCSVTTGRVEHRQDTCIAYTVLCIKDI